MSKKLFTCALLGIIATAAALHSHAQTISTVAGCGLGDDSLATHAELVGPVGIAVDTAGNTYIVETSSYRVRKVDVSGVITTFAGTGVGSYTGDGGPATAATLGTVYGVAADRFGNIYIADADHNCIRKVNAAGIISTIAGTGVSGFFGDGGPATAAKLNTPSDLACDTLGNIYVADWQNYRVRKISTAGIITTVVGNGYTTGGGNNGPATASSLGSPFRITLDNKGNLYVAAVVFQCISKIDTGGIIHIIAGTGAYAIGADGDGGMATDATMTSPCGLAIDTAGHIYFSDIGNNRIRMVDLNTGLISAYAASSTAGFSGDGGAATAAQISTPEDLACDAAGNLLICDADNNRVRKVTAGTMSTFAGQNGLFGEGYAATNAELCLPINLATDAMGNVFIVDYFNNRIRKIDIATGILTTVAGSGIAGYSDGYSGDGGPATAANIYNPSGIAFDAAGNMYIADASNSRVRKVNTSGIITTVAGDGSYGSSGDNGPATAAALNGPSGVAVDAANNVYIADQYNNLIRKVNGTTGIITTVAGNGFGAYAADHVAATATPINLPTDVVVDAAGNLYIADAGNSRIRMVDSSGIITTVAGSGTAGYSGDGGAATAAKLNFPNGIKVDQYGDLFIADVSNQAIRMVTSYGTISTVAGSNVAGFSGDGGLATAAKLNNPTGIAIRPSGTLYIADATNHRIRKTQVQLALPNVAANQTNISVYPNPAATVTNLMNAQGCTYVLTNALGNTVISGNANNDKETIDIRTLPVGLYMLEVADASGTKTTIKLVKG